MALPAYLSIKTKKSGAFKGNVKIVGREGQIAILAVSHDIISPRDVASSLPTGKRQHKPFIITKELDNTTPLFYTTLAINDQITDFVLTFYTIRSSDGKEVAVYTVTLKNANISSIHFEKPNVKFSEVASHPTMEVIAITYQKIEWVYLDGGIRAQDDWEVAV